MKKRFNFFFQGCYEAVINKAVENQHVVIGVSVGILALQILGIIFSFCLCKAIGKDRDYHYKYWHRDNAASTHPNAASRRPSSGNKQQPQQQESEQQTFLQNLQWISKKNWIKKRNSNLKEKKIKIQNNRHLLFTTTALYNNWWQPASDRKCAFAWMGIKQNKKNVLMFLMKK